MYESQKYGECFIAYLRIEPVKRLTLLLTELLFFMINLNDRFLQVLLP